MAPDNPIYFDQFQLIDGSWAEVCDRVARDAIANGVFFLGVTTTDLIDGASTNPIMIAGEPVTAKNGNMAVYGKKEFVFAAADSKWHEMGSKDKDIEISVDNGVLEINITEE